MIKKTLIVALFLLLPTISWANPNIKSKFYDFSDQLIDGEVQRPTTLYMDIHQEVKFQRLLRLERNFLGDNLWKTARDRIFK
jgi:hypothetical protein